MKPELSLTEENVVESLWCKTDPFVPISVTGKLMLIQVL